MTYALYTFSAENLPRNHSMMLTIPVVMYGLFRYLFLVRDGEVGASPEDLLFRDRPCLPRSWWALLAVTLLYSATSAQPSDRARQRAQGCRASHRLVPGPHDWIGAE